MQQHKWRAEKENSSNSNKSESPIAPPGTGTPQEADKQLQARYQAIESAVISVAAHLRRVALQCYFMWVVHISSSTCSIEVMEHDIDPYVVLAVTVEDTIHEDPLKHALVLSEKLTVRETVSSSYRRLLCTHLDALGVLVRLRDLVRKTKWVDISASFTSDLLDILSDDVANPNEALAQDNDDELYPYMALALRETSLILQISNNKVIKDALYRGILEGPVRFKKRKRAQLFVKSPAAFSNVDDKAMAVMESSTASRRDSAVSESSWSVVDVTYVSSALITTAIRQLEDFSVAQGVGTGLFDAVLHFAEYCEALAWARETFRRDESLTRKSDALSKIDPPPSVVVEDELRVMRLHVQYGQCLHQLHEAMDTREQGCYVQDFDGSKMPTHNQLCSITVNPGLLAALKDVVSMAESFILALEPGLDLPSHLSRTIQGSAYLLAAREYAQREDWSRVSDIFDKSF